MLKGLSVRIARGDDYLDAGLGEANPHGELLPHEDVWVVSLSETSLQLVQLARAEPKRHPNINMLAQAVMDMFSWPGLNLSGIQI